MRVVSIITTHAPEGIRVVVLHDGQMVKNSVTTGTLESVSLEQAKIENATEKQTLTRTFLCDQH